MSDNKSPLGMIAVTILTLIVGGGRILKNCGKSARVINHLEDASSLRHLDNLSNTNSIKRVGEGVNTLTTTNDAIEIFNEFEFNLDHPSKEEATLLLNNSILSTYFVNMEVDTIHRFNNLEVYVPNAYSIREYINKIPVLQFEHGLERIRICKLKLIRSHYSKPWADNHNGVQYKLRSQKYYDNILELSYYINVGHLTYQIYYMHEDVDKEDLKVSKEKLLAFIHLIKHNPS